jgi:hypothetical protein
MKEKVAEASKELNLKRQLLASKRAERYNNIYVVEENSYAKLIKNLKCEREEVREKIKG